MTVFEKNWITYQALYGLAKAHSLGVCLDLPCSLGIKREQIMHGDIKTENILVNTWNWVYLADFAPFKPVHLPDVISLFDL